MLNIGISEDKISWQAAGVLENTPKSEFSYPAIIQSADGMVHVTYTWKRKLIRYVKIDPAKLQLKPFNGSNWPF
jgi:alpha-L-rhamnosidase